MGIVASVLSAVLKAVVGDKAGSGLAKELIGISIDGISEKGINEITDFINGGKFKITQILSKENLKLLNIPEDYVDYVMDEIKELLYKINITDEVLRQCKYNCMNLSDFLFNEYKECKNDYIECEGEIKRCLSAIAEALIKLVSESESFEKDILLHISNFVDDANVGLENISDYLKENFGKLDDNGRMIFNLLLTILEQIQKMNMQGNEKKSTTGEEKEFKNNKKQDYIKIWNSKMFLHTGNNKKPMTLANAFIMPDYEMHKTIPRMDYFYFDTLDTIIKEFAEHEKTSTMLITGVPGIGKSSIISWIANEYKDDDRFIILRFRDWDGDELENGLLKAICNTLGCKNRDLKYKILILDGFDEMKSLDIRDRLLNAFFNDIKDRNNFKCIITSRPAYIDSSHFQNVIELKEFNIDKVDAFYRNIKGNGLIGREKVESNLEVLGIPVILYMAIMSGIDINEHYTKPELYNKIFAEKGGIFDRFYDGENEYSEGSQIMRNHENVKKYLQFLHEVSFMMFENNRRRLKIDDCNVPELEFQNHIVSILEFPIKHLFEDVKVNVEFIHNSICEYFVSEYIFSSLTTAIDLSTNELAGILGNLLRNNSLTNEILEFLEFKIKYNKLDKEFYSMDKAFQLMLQDGMTYYTKKNDKNIIKCEMNVFANMLEILHLWKNECLRFDSLIAEYLRYNRNSHLNLKETILRAGKKDNDGVLNLEKGLYLEDVYLEGADLEGANLTGAHLYGANLKNANLRGMDLKEANLKEADLRKADLTGAWLQFAQLESANLSKAILKKASLIRADLRGANLTDTDLTDAILDGSEWHASDVKKIFPQLKSAKFSYIIVVGCQKKKLYKNELFLNIISSSDSYSSFCGDSELRQNLEEASIDLLDFMMMDDYEKMKALEDAGIDSDMY